MCLVCKIVFISYSKITELRAPDMGQQQQKNTIKTLRQTAKDCLKDGRHTEAFLHLSHAIQLDKDNCELLSERSRCGRDNIQYHFAIEDAQQIIQLRPESWLGHVRLAEVYQVTFNYDLAIPAFQTAFQCLDADKSYCKLQIDTCKRESILDKRANMYVVRNMTTQNQNHC